MGEGEEGGERGENGKWKGNLEEEDRVLAMVEKHIQVINHHRYKTDEKLVALTLKRSACRMHARGMLLIELRYWTGLTTYAE